MDSGDRFEQLKAKFHAALELLDSGHVTLQNLNVQDDRLLVVAIAPSAEVRDRLIEAFKRADPSLAEVHPDIRLEDGEDAPATGQTTVQSTGSFSQPPDAS